MSTGDADTIELDSASHIHVASGLDTADGHHTHTSNSGVYETRYQKSLRHYLTREALPKESHYRNLDSIVDGSARPTLDDLHHNTLRDNQVSSARRPSPPLSPDGARREPRVERLGLLTLRYLVSYYTNCSSVVKYVLYYPLNLLENHRKERRYKSIENSHEISVTRATTIGEVAQCVLRQPKPAGLHS